MTRLRAVWRGIRLIGYFLEASGELIVDQPETRHLRAEWLHNFCARAMRGMGIPVSVTGDFPTAGAVIANHLSYLDIVVLASLRPCVFVAKAEIARMPVLGWMTTRSGTVYVERGRGGSAMRASEAMREAMDAGLPLVFFPEGTTSNGKTLLKFHTGLIGQARLAKAPMTAAFLRYDLTEDNGPGVSVEEDVCWGEKPLLKHIFGFLSLRGVHVDVRFGESPIAFSSDALHRKAAALEAQAAMVSLAGGLPLQREDDSFPGADLVRDA